MHTQGFWTIKKIEVIWVYDAPQPTVRPARFQNRLQSMGMAAQRAYRWLNSGDRRPSCATPRTAYFTSTYLPRA